MKRQYSALRLKKQMVYAQFDDAPKVRYKACVVVHEYLDEWEHPHCCYHNPTNNSWKKKRKTQYRFNNLR